MRRRLLLANSHAESGGGDSSLEFPINLVEGDNGQTGVDLYNYIYERKDSNDEYFFSDNEIVYVQGALMMYQAIGCMWIDTGMSTFVSFIGYIPDNEHFYMSLSLRPDGEFIVATD